MPRKETELDLNLLHKTMVKTASAGKILLKEALVGSRFAQVGANLFRDTVDNCIWKLEKGEDGGEYIVRAEPSGGMVANSSNEQVWTARADSTKEMVTLSFQGIPLCKFASNECGFDKDTVGSFERFLLTKVQDPQFVRSVYALATDKCPGCGNKPVYVGLDVVFCNTPDCMTGKITKAQGKLPPLQAKPTVALYVGGKYQGELTTDKAYAYEAQGLITIEQTPQGMVARKK